MRTGYLVYGYDSTAREARLIHDHRTEFVEHYQVSIRRGQDGKIYIRNFNGQSFEYYGDYSTLVDGEWECMLHWEMLLDYDTFEPMIYWIRGEEYTDLSVVGSIMAAYDVELVYDFEMFSWDPPYPENNINEMLSELSR